MPVDADGSSQDSGQSKEFVRPVAGLFKFTNINSNATTVVKASPALLHTITINKAGAAANTITVYNNTAGSGTVIALIDGAGVAAGRTLIFDVVCTTGLTIVTATGTAADITVSWL